MKGVARMYRGPTHTAMYFQQRRVQMHLSLTELARMVGYTNLSKGHRRIDDFERTGRCHPELFAKLTAALGVSDAELRAAKYLDYLDYLHTPANPPTPYLLQAGLKGCLGVPEELTTVEEMEVYASDYARRHGAAVCLVLDKRIYVRFAADGSLRDIVEALPPENPRGKRSC